MTKEEKEEARASRREAATNKLRESVSAQLRKAEQSRMTKNFEPSSSHESVPKFNLQEREATVDKDLFYA